MTDEEDPMELLPKFKFDEIGKTKLGEIKIKVTTLGENY